MGYAEALAKLLTLIIMLMEQHNAGTLSQDKLDALSAQLSMIVILPPGPKGA